MADQNKEVSVARDGHVAIVVIDRPPNNHVTVELMRGLADALMTLDGEKDIRCVVLASAGKAFCAGADFASSTPLGGGSEDGTALLYGQAVRLFSSKKPIVAAVQGAAVGAGLGLALVADFRVAAPEARFVGNFVKLGFHPGFGITHTLPRVVGQQRATLMCLTGRRVKAEEALEWGLVDELVPMEELRAAAMRLAREIAENAPLALMATRATMRADLAAAVKAQTDKEHAEQAILRKTKDFQEGILAVRERRPGNFTGA
jgi:enoyl-CoA hydratase/carnithine racemase